MVEEEERRLRLRARAALRANALPNRSPARLWGGQGSGALCPVCGEPVTAADAELELEFAADAAGPEAREFHLHVRCFAAWETERRDVT